MSMTSHHRHIPRHQKIEQACNGVKSVPTAILPDGALHRYRLPFTPTPDYPRVLAEDRQGNLRVGSERNGLLCPRPCQVQTFATADELVSDSAWAVCESRDGSVWIGADNGLNRFANGRQ